MRHQHLHVAQSATLCNQPAYSEADAEKKDSIFFCTFGRWAVVPQATDAAGRLRVPLLQELWPSLCNKESNSPAGSVVALGHPIHITVGVGRWANGKGIGLDARSTGFFRRPVASRTAAKAVTVGTEMVLPAMAFNSASWAESATRPQKDRCPQCNSDKTKQFTAQFTAHSSRLGGSRCQKKQKRTSSDIETGTVTCRPFTTPSEIRLASKP